MHPNTPSESFSEPTGGEDGMKSGSEEAHQKAPLQSQSGKQVWWLAGMVAMLSFGLFWMDGNVNPSFSDEGYLWHGMTALKAGQVPIRDFHAYDPGRYCWLVACSYLFGDGLVSMRASCVLFQCIGIWCGLLALRRLSKDWKFLILAGIILVLWMIPSYKIYEQAIGLMAIYVGVRLVENPTARSFFLTGIFIGFMAFFGRNHGVYQVAAFGLITLLITRADLRRLCHRMFVCGAGIVVGYLPQLLMLVFIPGYFDALIASIAVIFRYGTNVPLPIPWPWLALSEPTTLLKLHMLAMGLIFVGLILFVILSILQIWRIGLNAIGRYPVFLVSACVTGIYIHFSFSRADMVHLTHSAPLWLVGTLALSFTLKPFFQKWLPQTVLILILAVTLPTAVICRDLISEVLAPANRFVDVELGGQIMRAEMQEAEILNLAKKINRIMRPGESISFLPYLPGLYPAINRSCPTQQSYFIIPMTKEEEESTIADFKSRNVKWVILQFISLDKRNESGFRNTNPLTFAYLTKNFELAANYPELKDTVVLRRKD